MPLLLLICTVLAATTVLSSALAARTNTAPTVLKRCWAGDRFGHNNTPNPQVKHPERYANCNDCLPIPADVKCELWYGWQTSGGGTSVSHRGWPGLTGVRWQVIIDSNSGESKTGSSFNDGLYGRNGSDSFRGGPGDDILWSDANVKVNDTRQHDLLDGGPGNDWLYAAKGENTLLGGSGNDRVFAVNGHGTIDCGSGRDIIHVSRYHPTYRYRNCEVIVHPGAGTVILHAGKRRSAAP